MSADALKELQQIPGVGKSIAADLLALGINHIAELKGRNPEEMYVASNKLVGVQQDRCLLYVFRCAVYYATKKQHDPKLLKWWHWKEITITPSGKVKPEIK